MQYKQLAAVAAFAGLANAQSQCAPIIQSFDPCVLGPIAEVAYSSFSCDIINFSCQCDHITEIANVAFPIAGNPPNTAASCDAGSAYDVATNLCSCVTSNSADSLTLNAVQSACEASAVAIPPCALGYIAEAGNKNHGCDIQDFECQCSNSDAIQSEVFDQVTSICGVVYAAQSVLPAVSSVCACVTSAVANPGSAGPTTTPGSGPTSAMSPSTSPTVSGVSSTSAVSSGGSSSGSPSGSSSGSKGPSGSSSGSKGPSGSGSGSPSASGTKTGSSPVVTGSMTGSSSGPAMQGPSTTGGTKSMPHFTGAGATASAFGGLFGVVAGVVAFL